MSSIPKYIQLIKHISNWTLYFKRMHEKGATARYRTRGTKLVFDVPPRFYEVFREIFMEDFYRIDDLVRHLPVEPVVVDIGGNVGFFSFLLSSKKPGAKIYAFEPMIENVKVFNDNCKLNPSLTDSIFLFNQAVTADNNGHIDLFFDNVTDNSVIASVVKDFSTQNTQVKKVDAISLERIFQENSLERVDLLKVDCEGSEYPIFYDSPAWLFDKVQTIALESHELDTEKRNTESLTRFLEDKGFTVDRFVAENNCYYLKAYRK
ncbi:MAG: FkbM family methyltransferase [Sediminibacterium sp.]